MGPATTENSHWRSPGSRSDFQGASCLFCSVGFVLVALIGWYVLLGLNTSKQDTSMFRCLLPRGKLPESQGVAPETKPREGLGICIIIITIITMIIIIIIIICFIIIIISSSSSSSSSNHVLLCGGEHLGRDVG